MAQNQACITRSENRPLGQWAATRERRPGNSESHLQHWHSGARPTEGDHMLKNFFVALDNFVTSCPLDQASA